MRGWAWVLVLGLGACTAINPAYEAGDGESGPVSGDAGPGTSEGMVTTEGDVTGEPTCELHPLRPFDIQVSTMEPKCVPGSEIAVLEPGANIYPMSWNLVQHEQCQPTACDCTSEPPLVEIQLADDAVFAEGVGLPDCGRVVLWARLIDDECQWAGLAMWDGDEAAPSLIVSRTLDPPSFDNFGELPFELELGDGEPCATPEVCDGRPPGRYPIDVSGHGPVTVEESPPLIEIAVAGVSRNYLFDNRMSSVTRDCRQQIAWTAQLWP